jgi:hypothetical protein
MKTNLQKNQNAVITTDSGEVVAVVECKAGQQDLTAQISKAISEHECADNVQINKTEGNFEFLEPVELFVTVLDEEGNEDDKSFYIELTATY